MSNLTRIQSDMVVDPVSGTKVSDQFGTLSNNLGGHGVNVMYPPAPLVAPKGDGVTDDTQTVQAIGNNLNVGDTLFFPKGTFLTNTGFTFTKEINIEGISEDLSVIKNTSANPCIYINPTTRSGYRHHIKNITIQGNGTQNYGADATSGHGIQFNNTSYWDIHGVRVLYHGGHGIYISGSCWTMTFDNCFSSYNKQDGLNCIATSSATQINNINILNNTSLTNNGANGANLWGVNLNVIAANLAGNKGAGVCVNSDNVTSSYSCYGINIENNYFESNAAGNIYVKTSYNTYSRYIHGLKIEGNYLYTDTSKANVGLTANCVFAFSPVDTSSTTILNMSWKNNAMYNTSTTTIKYVDFGGGFDYSSSIWCERGQIEAGTIINTGLAKLMSQIEKITLNGYCTAKGVGWSSLQQSDNVATGTTVTFPVQVTPYSNPIYMGVYCNTDSTNYSVQLNLLTRSDGVGSYTSLWNVTLSGKSGSQLIQTNHIAAYGLKQIINSDCILQITVTITTAGTYFNLGNPFIELNMVS